MDLACLAFSSANIGIALLMDVTKGLRSGGCWSSTTRGMARAGRRPEATQMGRLLTVVVALARVISIGDGDTIRVLQGQQRLTIRLACIDAPEMAQSPYGANARTYLQSRLRLGSIVTLKPQTLDRFGRTVAEVIGEVNLNLAMVEEGQAFAYRKYLGQCNAQQYLDAEARASRRRIGVWQVSGGITRPWDFRRVRASTRSGGAS